MTDQLWLLATLLALLTGMVSGRAWERYKLRDGRWVDRRRLRDTPHYMLGLNFLVARQIDEAIDELGQAAAAEPDALELQMILGNLFREKGQVTRAISTHQALLQRQGLSPVEHAYVLLCLGLDFRRGGFVDRAAEAFREVLVPAEKDVELVKGKKDAKANKRTSTRKFFPGYILVNVGILGDFLKAFIKNTPRVTGFVGGTDDPPAISEAEVREIAHRMEEGAVKPKPKVLFESGENVKVVDGPFQDFNGVVEEVKPDKGKLRVLISIFGRATPVELDFVQVEKA